MRTLSQKGYTLITILFIFVILLFLISSTLVLVMKDLHISQSQKGGAESYFAAEAGIREGMYLLEKDAWSDRFAQGGAGWEETLDEKELVTGQSYSVKVQGLGDTPNTRRAKLTATGFSQTSQGDATRIIEVIVSADVGTGGASSVLNNLSLYSGSTLNIQNTTQRVDISGPIHAESNADPAILFQQNNDIRVNRTTSTVGTFSEVSNGRINMGTIIEGATPITPPWPYIDLNLVKTYVTNEVTPATVAKRAEGPYTEYTAAQFISLLQNKTSMSFPTGVRITGDVSIVGGSNSINRSLVLTVNGDISVVGNFSIATVPGYTISLNAQDIEATSNINLGLSGSRGPVRTAVGDVYANGRIEGYSLTGTLGNVFSANPAFYANGIFFYGVSNVTFGDMYSTRGRFMFSRGRNIVIGNIYSGPTNPGYTSLDLAHDGPLRTGDIHAYSISSGAWGSPGAINLGDIWAEEYIAIYGGNGTIGDVYAVKNSLGNSIILSSCPNIAAKSILAGEGNIRIGPSSVVTLGQNDPGGIFATGNVQITTGGRPTLNGLVYTTGTYTTTTPNTTSIDGALWANTVTLSADQTFSLSYNANKLAKALTFRPSTEAGLGPLTVESWSEKLD